MGARAWCVCDEDKVGVAGGATRRVGQRTSTPTARRMHVRRGGVCVVVVACVCLMRRFVSVAVVSRCMQAESCVDEGEASKRRRWAVTQEQRGCCVGVVGQL